MCAHIMRVRRTQGKGSGLAVALPSDFVSRHKLQFDDLLIASEEDGALHLVPVTAEMLKALSGLHIPIDSRGKTALFPHPAKTRATEARR